MLLSTDTGGIGLNLQHRPAWSLTVTSPGTPARLEQRVARAWRKGPERTLSTVLNLVSERTVEQRMLTTLANKQALSDGVLDPRGDLEGIKMMGGAREFPPATRNASPATRRPRPAEARRSARPAARGRSLPVYVANLNPPRRHRPATPRPTDRASFAGRRWK